MGVARYDIDAETELLKIFLSDQYTFEEFREITRPEMFSDYNKFIYMAMCAVDSNGYEFDEITLRVAVKKLSANIPDSYLLEMFNEPKNKSFAPAYHQIIFDVYKRYETFNAGEEIKKRISEGKPFCDIIDIVNKVIGFEGNSATNNRPQSIHEIAKEQVRELDKDIKGEFTIQRKFRLGHPVMDKMGVITRGNIVVIGARPSHGKTLIAINLMYHQAFINKKRCVFFSLEMSKFELLEKLYCLHENFPTQTLMEMPDEKRYELLSKFEKLLSVMNIDIVIDSDHRDITSIVSTAKILNAQKQIDFIYIDYVQLIMINGRQSEQQRNQQLSTINLQIKNNIASQLNVCVILLAQINRDGEKEEDRVPRMSDLADCSQIEKDASQVWFVKNWHLIGKSVITVGAGKKVDCNGALALINGKSRFGASGGYLLVPVSFLNQKIFSTVEESLANDERLRMIEQTYKKGV